MIPKSVCDSAPVRNFHMADIEKKHAEAIFNLAMLVSLDYRAYCPRAAKGCFLIRPVDVLPRVEFA